MRGRVARGPRVAGIVVVVDTRFPAAAPSTKVTRGPWRTSDEAGGDSPDFTASAGRESGSRRPSWRSKRFSIVLESLRARPRTNSKSRHSRVPALTSASRCGRGVAPGRSRRGTRPRAPLVTAPSPLSREARPRHLRTDSARTHSKRYGVRRYFGMSPAKGRAEGRRQSRLAEIPGLPKYLRLELKEPPIWPDEITQLSILARVLTGTAGGAGERHNDEHAYPRCRGTRAEPVQDLAGTTEEELRRSLGLPE